MLSTTSCYFYDAKVILNIKPNVTQKGISYHLAISFTLLCRFIVNHRNAEGLILRWNKGMAIDIPRQLDL